MLTKEKPTVSEKIRTFGPWIKWLVKKEFHEYKATSAYIEMLCPNPKVKSVEDSSIRKLENLVRATIISEFGGRIEHSKGFNLLVNSVMYKLQKESLGSK
ncbi:MAG: hypothetical protein AB1782_04800 [Cyanobacteriota bacterium]